MFPFYGLSHIKNVMKYKKRLCPIKWPECIITACTVWTSPSDKAASKVVWILVIFSKKDLFTNFNSPKPLIISVISVYNYSYKAPSCLQEFQSLSGKVKSCICLPAQRQMWVQSVTLYACMFICVHRETQRDALRGGAQRSDHTSTLTRCSSIVNEHGNCRSSKKHSAISLVSRGDHVNWEIIWHVRIQLCCILTSWHGYSHLQIPAAMNKSVSMC